MNPDTPLPPPPPKGADFEDDFATEPSTDTWVAHYLPQWTVAERSAARYAVTPDGLELRIEEDQLDWRPEDAPLRVSNLQTGTYSGPVGSAVGTHRHRADGLLVRTETPTRLLFAPSSGRVDVTVTASADEGCMTAAWLVGTEHLSPEDSGEICLFEIDANPAPDPQATRARLGIKAHHDSRLHDDMVELSLPMSPRERHTWSAIWGAGETIIGVDGTVLRSIPQAPDYPMFLMLDLFELTPTPSGYPKTAQLHHVRAWEGRPGSLENR